MNTCMCGNQSCRIEYGKCHCGCGEKTTIAPRNHKDRGWIKGQPIRYIKGHAQDQRPDLHTLSAINIRNRRAVCSFCGEVTIKRDSSRKPGWRCTGKINTEHRIVEIDKRLRKGYCLGCLELVDIIPKPNKSNPGRWACLTNLRLQQTQDREKHARKSAAKPSAYRKYHLKKNYGLTLGQYDAKVIAQEGACQVCKEQPATNSERYYRLVVDHCHKTGMVRDLLCNRCNRILGMANEDQALLQSLIDYLLRWEKA